MEYTHIALNYPSNMQEMLFRASDGMCIGQRKAETVVYGISNRAKESRVFVDAECASRFLRGQVALDEMKERGIVGFPVVIEERDGQRGLYLPEDSMDIPREGIVKFN